MYLSSDQLKKEMLSLLLKEKNENGLPIIFTFIDGTVIDQINFDNNKLLVNVFTNTNKNEVYIKADIKNKYFYDISILPYTKIINVELHPNYKNPKLIPDFEGKKFKIAKEFLELIKVNERKTIVFEFSDYIYLPGYELNPSKTFKIDVGVLKLSSDKGRSFNSCIVFYLARSKNTFYKGSYIPLDKCLSWENIENNMYKEANKRLKTITEDKDINIIIRTTKTKELKQLTLSSKMFLDQIKKENLFPLLYTLKFNKVNDRTHENCLVCGTKLFSKEQIYVHLLNDGNLSTDASPKSINHFSFFPVGKECLSLIPENYLFSKEFLIKTNR